MALETVDALEAYGNALLRNAIATSAVLGGGGGSGGGPVASNGKGGEGGKASKKGKGMKSGKGGEGSSSSGAGTTAGGSGESFSLIAPALIQVLILRLTRRFPFYLPAVAS